VISGFMIGMFYYRWLPLRLGTSKRNLMRLALPARKQHHHNRAAWIDHHALTPALFSFGLSSFLIPRPVGTPLRFVPCERLCLSRSPGYLYQGNVR
jgi:hypothetical protein